MDKIREYRSRLQSDYVRLADVVPLETPFTLLIDPANACNFRCVFCPTGDDALLKRFRRPKGIMDFSLYKKIIDDLGVFEAKLKKLQLYKDGEPLLNKRLVDMVAYAKSREVAEIVETTTNAALLNEAVAEALLDAGLDRIRISVEHVSDDGYKEVTKTYSDYCQIKENVARLFAMKTRKKYRLQIHVKLLDIGFSENEKLQFINDFEDICDTLNIDQLMGWSGSYSDGRDFALGQAPDTAMDGATPLARDRKVCSAPFKSLAINFDGTVSVCCVDWRMETIVGNLYEQSLADVWNGDALRNFRLTHLRGERYKLTACVDCSYMQGFSEHENMDGDREQLATIFAAEDLAR